MFLDETGFLTIPYRRRSWAPAGQTPVIVHRLRHRRKVTVLGSLTLSPQRRRCGLYADFHPDRSVNVRDQIAHLRALRRRLRTPLVVVLDNLNAHHPADLRAWCAKVKDVHLAFLPPYAPDLNPIEAAWSHGKYHTTAGRVADTADELLALAQTAVSHARQQRLLRAFLRSTGLPLRWNLHQRKDQSGTQ